MEMLTSIFAISLGAILTNNFVLSRFWYLPLYGCFQED